MSRCVTCGLYLSGDAALCSHHPHVYGDDWAIANRLMCDFFHRKRTLTAPQNAETLDEYLARIDRENRPTHRHGRGGAIRQGRTARQGDRM